MPDIAAMESGPQAGLHIAVPEVLEFTVLSQKLELEVDFSTLSLTGTTVLEIQPWSKDLKKIKLNARQCVIQKEQVTVDGQPCGDMTLEDSYKRIDIPDWAGKWSASNWVEQRDRILGLVQNTAEPELTIHLPKGFVIKEANPEQLGDLSTTAGLVPTSAANAAITLNSDAEYLPIHISIPFSVPKFREGLHFVGLENDDFAYPHVYTQHSSIHSGISRCIFPCFDNPKVKPLWTISITCGRTLGDALTRRPTAVASATSPKRLAEIDESDLDADDRLREMIVVCSGDLVKDVIHPMDSTRKIVTFEVDGNKIWAGHIAFAIGPFEYVNLSCHRAEEEDRLGQKAVKVNGYCLPGRSGHLNNAALPIAPVIDRFCMMYGAYPFTDYTLCFVADQVQDTVDSAALTLCSDRLLHSEEVIDELQPVARKLIHALARQYVGVSILPDKPEDTWLVVGIAHFIADSVMLFGNNQYQFDMKKKADRLLELDLHRPALHSLGTILNLGPSEFEFMELKASLVLQILDRRIAKKSGSAGLERMISKVITNASTSADRVITEESFQRVCEKLGHLKLVDFFNQWVHSSGYPRFVITQKYDKKNMRIKMTIKQTQGSDSSDQEHKLKKSEFAREAKEELNAIYADEKVFIFTGPMTIRIHEADGMPYEHIIEIDSREKSFDLPYNTKYKREKRNRRQKERENAVRGEIDGPDDMLIWCLGDVLQSEQEIKEWKLTGWDKETLAKIEVDPFEWISIDADHEWRISQVDHAMELHMFASQLQQDRDVIAHINAIKFMAKCPPNPVISSILVRTVMDDRYFYGVRTMAAETLAVHATAATDWIGKFHLEKAFKTLFCYPNTQWTPLPNNFHDWEAYEVRNAIAMAMSKIRDEEGNCPLECRTFIYDQLRLNDNSDNFFTDSYYVANLLKALADSMVPRKAADDGTVGFVTQMSEGEQENLQTFQQSALEEIERYQKIDKTMTSWKNVYTRATLDARKRLMQAKLIPSDPREFIAYIQKETCDLVQIDAMAAIVDMGMLIKSTNIINFFVDAMTTSSSPFIRDKLVEIFWRGLASLAFGEHLEKESDAADDDGLILYEGQEQSDARATQIARATTIKGALAALKEDLKGLSVLKEALWEAVKSSVIGLSEQMTILEFCTILYDPETSCLFTLKYPSYWKVEHRGKGLLVFSKTNIPRTKLTKQALPLLLPPPPPPASAPAVQPTASAHKKLKFFSNNNNGEMLAPAKPSIPKSPAPKPPTASRPPAAPAAKRTESVSSSSTIASYSQSTAGQTPKAKPTRIVILRMNADVLRAFPTGPSTSNGLSVSKKRKASSEIPSPVPLAPPVRSQSIVLKYTNGPSNSIAASRTPTPGPVNSTPAPARRPLPDSSTKIRIPLPDGRTSLPDGNRTPLPDGRTPLPDGPPRKAKRPHQSEDGDEPRPPHKMMITLKLSGRKAGG